MSEPGDAMRVSGAERDAVVQALGVHASVGRLTLDELEERSTAALTAKTRGDLATLTSDLSAPGDTTGLAASAPADRPRRPVRWIVALIGGAHIYVPDTVEVDTGGFSLLGAGGVQQLGPSRDPRPGAPVIRVRGFALLGGSNVYRVPTQMRGLSTREIRFAALRGRLSR